MDLTLTLSLSSRSTTPPVAVMLGVLAAAVDAVGGGEDDVLLVQRATAAHGQTDHEGELALLGLRPRRRSARWEHRTWLPARPEHRTWRRASRWPSHRPDRPWPIRAGSRLPTASATAAPAMILLVVLRSVCTGSSSRGGLQHLRVCRWRGRSQTPALVRELVKPRQARCAILDRASTVWQEAVSSGNRPINGQMRQVIGCSVLPGESRRVRPRLPCVQIVGRDRRRE